MLKHLLCKSLDSIAMSRGEVPHPRAQSQRPILTDQIHPNISGTHASPGHALELSLLQWVLQHTSQL